MNYPRHTELARQNNTNGCFRRDCLFAGLSLRKIRETVVELHTNSLVLISGAGMNSDFAALWERHEDGWLTRSTNTVIEHYDPSGCFRGIELVIQQ